MGRKDATMKSSDIALLINEPACSNNANKAKGGCTRPETRCHSRRMFF